MRLTLVRHGDAGPSHNVLGDEGRCLTPRGRQQALVTGRALREQGIELSHAWTSPLVRAVQTAELIVSSFDYAGSIEARAHLYPDSNAHDLLRALAELGPGADTHVLVVSHMPYVAATAGTILGMSVSSFYTAEAFHMQLADPIAPGQAELKWRWTGR